MKKQLLLLLTVLTLCLSLVACANKESTTDEESKEPTSDASEIVGTQKEDVTDNEGKYYYKELNVNDFDPSKFDGIIKFDKRYAFKGDIAELKAPFTFAQMQEADLFFEEGALDVNKLEEMAEDSFSIISPSLYSHNENSEDGTVIVIDTLIPNSKDSGLTFKQVIEEGTFILYAEDAFLGDLINVDLEDPNTTEFKDVVSTLGAPKLIYGDAMSLDGDLSSGFFSYIYKYDNYALAFNGLEFTGDDDSGTFYEFYYMSNDKAYDAYIKMLEGWEYTNLTQ